MKYRALHSLKAEAIKYLHVNASVPGAKTPSASAAFQLHEYLNVYR
jgi:hypothetical protein